MWYFLGNCLEYTNQDARNVFSSEILSPDWDIFPGKVFSIESPIIWYKWYDDWVWHFDRSDDIKVVQDALRFVKDHKKRAHVRGISTREAVEEIREYYRQKWYEDAFAKNYSLPPNELFTVSVSLGQSLWCEKDKDFLQSKNSQNLYYYAHTPPFRSSADLRSLQQALRMGLIIGLEVPIIHEGFLSDLLKKQILTMYQIGTMTSMSWRKHGITWEARNSLISVPIFSNET